MWRPTLLRQGFAGHFLVPVITPPDRRLEFVPITGSARGNGSASDGSRLPWTTRLAQFENDDRLRGIERKLDRDGHGLVLQIPNLLPRPFGSRIVGDQVESLLFQQLTYQHVAGLVPKSCERSLE